MHYYSFNIGDYASHTSRLSPMEDLAYRRLLDLYYLNEQPLNGCASDVAREVGLMDHVDSVEYVLGKFFEKNENVFRQKRIDLEIKKYKSNSKNKSKAGIASAKARRAKASKGGTGVEQVLNTTSTDEQLNNNHKPLTNNHIKDKELVVQQKQVSTSPVLFWMPLNDKTEFEITEEQFNKWVGLYQAVDIELEIRKMIGWLDANPSKRKTRKGILRFANSWISKVQDKGGSQGYAPSNENDNWNEDLGL